MASNDLTPQAAGIRSDGTGATALTFALSVGGGAFRDVTAETLSERIEITFERGYENAIFGSIRNEFAEGFEFVGQAARDLIAEFERNALAGQAVFRILRLDEPVYESRLKFGELEYAQEKNDNALLIGKVKIAGEPTSFQYRFRQRADRPVALSEFSDVGFRAQPLQQQSAADASNAEAVRATGVDTVEGASIVASANVEASECGETFGYAEPLISIRGGASPQPFTNRTYVVRFAQPGRTVFTLTAAVSGTLSVPFNVPETATISVQYYLSPGGSRQIVASDTISLPTAGAEVAFDVSGSVAFSQDIEEDDEFYYYVDIEFSGGQIGQSFDMNVEFTSGSDVLAWSAVQDVGADDSLVPCIRPFDALAQIVETNTGEAARLVSDFFNAGGPGRDYWLTYGSYLRGDTARPFATSWEALFEKGLARIFALGWGFETDANGDTVVRVEPLDYFFGSERVLDLSEFSLKSVKLALETYYATLRFGYRKWEIESFGGRNEFNTLLTYNAGGDGTEESGGELEAVSEQIIASGTIIEETRRLALSPSRDASDKHDEATFIVDVYDGGDEVAAGGDIEAQAYFESGPDFIFISQPVLTPGSPAPTSITVTGSFRNDGTYGITSITLTSSGELEVGVGSAISDEGSSTLPKSVTVTFNQPLNLRLGQAGDTRRLEGVTSVSGVPLASGAYNLRLNPARIAERYLNYLQGSTLEAVKAEGLNGWDIEFGGKSYAEGADLTVPPSRLFGKKVIEIESAAVDFQDLLPLILNPNGLRVLAQDGAGVGTYAPLTLSYNVAERTANLTVIQLNV